MMVKYDNKSRLFIRLRLSYLISLFYEMFKCLRKCKMMKLFAFWIIRFRPKIPRLFRHIVVFDAVVDVGLVGLAQLVAAVDAVRPTVFDEVSTRLVETERNLFGDALRTKIKDPIEIARPRPDTGLTTDTHLLYRVIQPSRDVHPLKHRRHND